MIIQRFDDLLAAGLVNVENLSDRAPSDEVRWKRGGILGDTVGWWGNLCVCEYCTVYFVWGRMVFIYIRTQFSVH